MAKAASSTELKNGFEQHLSQTEKRIERLEQGVDILGEKKGRKACVAMEGLIKENKKGDVLDAALIVATQKVEHYEMAAVRTYAQLIGYKVAPHGAKSERRSDGLSKCQTQRDDNILSPFFYLQGSAKSSRLNFVQIVQTICLTESRNALHCCSRGKPDAYLFYYPVLLLFLPTQAGLDAASRVIFDVEIQTPPDRGVFYFGEHAMNTVSCCCSFWRNGSSGVCF